MYKKKHTHVGHIIHTFTHIHTLSIKEKLSSVGYAAQHEDCSIPSCHSPYCTDRHTGQKKRTPPTLILLYHEQRPPIRAIPVFLLSLSMSTTTTKNYHHNAINSNNDDNNSTAATTIAPTTAVTRERRRTNRPFSHMLLLLIPRDKTLPPDHLTATSLNTQGTTPPEFSRDAYHRHDHPRKQPS